MTESIQQQPERRKIDEAELAGLPTKDLNFIQAELMHKQLGESPDTNSLKKWIDDYSKKLRVESGNKEIQALWKEGKKEEAKKMLEEMVFRPPHN
ncbi:MAG: hypothetical protein PHN74_03595 [Candidatus Pacebacteria bacterium]|nr:hypothetical protein [Candidatus Paceibacterota bacterium]